MFAVTRSPLKEPKAAPKIPKHKPFPLTSTNTPKPSKGQEIIISFTGATNKFAA